MIKQLTTNSVADMVLISKSLRLETKFLNFCAEPDSFFKAFGIERDGKLASFVCVHFNDDNNSWTIAYLFCANGTDGIRLVKHVMRLAETCRFYQFFVADTDERSRRFATVAAKISKYEAAVDERVPENQRPFTSIYWNWLFLNVTRPTPTVITHFWLPSRFRK